MKVSAPRRGRESGVDTGFQALFFDNPQPMWLYSPATLDFVEVNDAACSRYGYSRDQFLALNLADVNVDAPPAQSKPSGPAVEKHRLNDGRLIDAEVHSRLVRFRGRPAILGVVHDVTEHVQLGEQLQHQARHDVLTGLANRALFHDLVDKAGARVRRGGRPFAVLFVDLDNFKTVNDSLGHKLGDEVLVEAARRIRAAVRPVDTVGRLGGDEFGVLLDSVPSSAAATRLARRIATRLEPPMTLQGQRMSVTASVGVAFSADCGEETDVILRSADIAMYDAKKAGRARFAVFEPAMHDSEMARLQLEVDLHRALPDSQVKVLFQPVIDLRTARPTAVEALIEWHHPLRGAIPAGKFVPLAEETGLIGEIDEWVLRTGAAQVRAWRDTRAPGLALSVNVSGLEFDDPKLPDRVMAAASEAGIAATGVILEITESLAFETENAREALSRLRGLGFRIAVDDFGVGFSMLGRLQDLPVDILKIDKSFVDRITFGEDEAPIISAVIAMAHSMGLIVVAEGIETSEQLGFLRRSGCDWGQGYRLGRPVKALEIEDMLSRLGPQI